MSQKSRNAAEGTRNSAFSAPIIVQSAPSTIIADGATHPAAESAPWTGVRNALLATLPREELARLWQRLEPVNLVYRQVLLRAGAAIEAAYFVESGCVSMLAKFRHGGALEVGLIGREGLVGMPLVLETERSTTEAVVQIAGKAFRIDGAALKEELDRSPALHTALLRYGQALHAQVERTAACNGHHTLPQRLARWLLMAHDRADGDQLPVTQELLSTMLGVRRAGVATSIATLQRSGAVRFSRACVRILDRQILEAASCECYFAAE